MKQIICIGECALDTVFSAGRPVGAMPGGRIYNAAIAMARRGLPVTLASEAAADPVGDILVDALADAGVDTACVDRFIQGRSPLVVLTPDADCNYKVTRYEEYGTDGGFDIVWPRVDDETIVVFGGYYTLDARMRERMEPFLKNCSERKAVMVYVPGFHADRQRRMTRVMPTILENIEMADLVISRTDDLAHIFEEASDGDCYADHIDFYNCAMINIDPTARSLRFFNARERESVDIAAPHCDSMLYCAGVIAGTVAAMVAGGIGRESLACTDAALRRRLLESAAEYGAEAVDSAAEEWMTRIR